MKKILARFGIYIIVMPFSDHGTVRRKSIEYRKYKYDDSWMATRDSEDVQRWLNGATYGFGDGYNTCLKDLGVQYRYKKGGQGNERYGHNGGFLS